MGLPYTLATLARRGLLNPGLPHRTAAQFSALRVWGYGLAGELRSAAARDRDAIAIIDETCGEITYGQLLRWAERLARALRGVANVRDGDRVGLLCRNHAGMVEAMLAVSMLGADAVLVNTGLSNQQLTTIAEELRLRALIHDHDFGERVVAVPIRGLGPRRPRPHHDPAPLVVERLDESRVDHLIQEAPPGEMRPPPREGRTIVLTSGTTGTPKGARRPTPPNFDPLASILGRIPLRAGARIMIAAPLFHTWGYAALQVALALRATIVLQRRFDPAETLAALTRHRCTALFAVPVMLQRLLDVPVPNPRPPLRVVATSGSALPGGLATRFMDAYGDILYNLYGSTEASWVSIATPRDLRRAPGTAGRPPHGTKVAILDEDGRPLPAGTVGRIFVSNDMLFEGYTSGGSVQSSDGLLSTGDLGHVDDGLLFVDGRQDDMIISGGENIFPSEVEDLLAGLPQVREVAVVGVQDADYGQRLAAYLALHPGERLDPEAVREYVRHYLARYAVPRDVYYVPALPRNATGKVVVNELPYCVWAPGATAWTPSIAHQEWAASMAQPPVAPHR
jgi:acyl-CoA synthetase (AMP-forming)/AMP-acid ligase II